MWAILIVTLPTQPNAVRLRVWRALKALGCAALRDGAYLLPAEHAALFEPLAAEVREHGGTASVLALTPRDEAQREELLALFDRTRGLRAVARDARPRCRPNSRRSARPRRGGACAAWPTRCRRCAASTTTPARRPSRRRPTWRRCASALDARFSQGEPQARADATASRGSTAQVPGQALGDARAALGRPARPAPG